MTGVLRLEGIVRTFRQGGKELKVLRGASLSVRLGEVVALVGPSGSGKSTLLHIAGLLEPPDGGEVIIRGRRCNGLSEYERTLVRREKIGFVYQFHHLLREFDAAENVMLPLRIRNVPKAEARAKAETLLKSLGLGGRAGHSPGQLSGGEQQRVAIARALANDPDLVLADEPTGNLDEATAGRVLEAFVRAVKGDEGRAALIATHNLELARRMDCVLTLHDGKISANK